MTTVVKNPTVTLRVMAHQSRAEWAHEIAERVGAEIVWDEVGHAWDTGRRALLSGLESGASHVAILQDDVIVSEGLPEVVAAQVGYSGEHPIGLYAGDSPKTRAALAEGPDPWYAMSGPTWGPGLVIPTEHVIDLLAYGDRMRMTSYDTRLWRWYEHQGILCWYTNPSLVQHRTGHGSLINRGRDRQAPAFGSGLGKDWSRPPMVFAKSSDLFPWVVVADPKTPKRSKRVRRHTDSYRRAIRGGWVEV